MSPVPAPEREQRQDLVDLYDEGVADVYGYLAARTGSAAVAEDLTSETFLAAVEAVRSRKVAEMTMAWLIGVARHKLVDHWRKVERDSRLLHSVDADHSTDADEWDVRLDMLVAHRTLELLGTHHRSALTLRYLDGLPVREVADCLGRTEGATEVLLVRARRAFRHRYEQEEAGR